MHNQCLENIKFKIPRPGLLLEYMSEKKSAFSNILHRTKYSMKCAFLYEINTPRKFYFL